MSRCRLVQPHERRRLDRARRRRRVVRRMVVDDRDGTRDSGSVRRSQSVRSGHNSIMPRCGKWRTRLLRNARHDGAAPGCNGDRLCSVCTDSSCRKSFGILVRKACTLNGGRRRTLTLFRRELFGLGRGLRVLHRVKESDQRSPKTVQAERPTLAISVHHSSASAWLLAR